MNNSVHDIADYIISRFDYGASDLTMLKLQKLLYYADAWYLANDRERNQLINENFEAWVHGPVCREVFDRFKETHSLYSIARRSDLKDDFNAERICQEDRDYLDEFLNDYGSMSGAELETMSHGETPWIEARGDSGILDVCTTVINKQSMGRFYENLLIRDGLRTREDAIWL